MDERFPQRYVSISILFHYMMFYVKKIELDGVFKNYVDVPSQENLVFSCIQSVETENILFLFQLSYMYYIWLVYVFNYIA